VSVSVSKSEFSFQFQNFRTCRVDLGVSAQAPHRPGRADFPHPVLRAVVSPDGYPSARLILGSCTSSLVSYLLSPCSMCLEALLSLPFIRRTSPPCFSRHPPLLGWLPSETVRHRLHYYEDATTTSTTFVRISFTFMPDLLQLRLLFVSLRSQTLPWMAHPWKPGHC
jgi:hypothetical protein